MPILWAGFIETSQRIRLRFLPQKTIMITRENFRQVLQRLGFRNEEECYVKKFKHNSTDLKVDFKTGKLLYPKETKVNDKIALRVDGNENLVVFECVNRLLEQGYHPKHIEIEPRWQVGHGASGGRADILIKDNRRSTCLIIECKTPGREFKSAWEKMQSKPSQLFSYVQQAKSARFIALYTSDWVDGKVVPEYRLINIQDNEALLRDNPKLKSYKEATTVGELYAVWQETYGGECATLGLFENNRPYDIGKEKYTSEDLKSINSKDIQGKYHDFANILRQHNVSGRENAFDKLVNLFLCKVTDEKTNPKELAFYWKGKAYDNPFDFQERLQVLYKKGMSKFLQSEITHIDNQLIEEAFEVFKDKPNATKDRIKEFMKQQKFFTNNDFAFIDVHNESLFYQNFEVLLKITQLIQDISLTSSDENQFLGDLFEGFLDQGVKQSEGQYFTPLPIVKFIIHSLPKRENPKVIDYACGAGHFLNEYASINPGAHLVGIEKEYRISKVAKVSSFMYGSDAEIIYADALVRHEKVQENCYDILITNPPYAVKGFLETLDEEERERYTLTNHIVSKSYSKNDTIACFFVERAKQLLKKEGVAAIILPISILSNTNGVYVATREIILQYFDIIAIAAFGSGTFGKTGTNTVTLFLKRRGSNPAPADHLQHMVDAWFKSDFTSNVAFKDEGILNAYCAHIGIKPAHYKKLLSRQLDSTLWKHDTFKDYKAAFEKKQQKQQTLLDYILAIEKEKVYYFALASQNQRPVIIVKTPTATDERKKFLGYSWSTRKGNEGIQYLSAKATSIKDEKLEESDKRILANMSQRNA